MKTQVVKHDPPVGKKCAQCGNTFKITPRAGVNPAEYIDPFCSALCARAWHGVPLPVTAQGRKKEDA